MDVVQEIITDCTQFDSTISLDFENRFKRRVKLSSDSGYEFFLAL